MKLPNVHIELVDLLEISRQKTLNRMSGKPQSYTEVCSANGINFYENNTESASQSAITWFALNEIEKPVLWVVEQNIVWGSFHVFRELIAKKVKAVVVINRDNDLIAKLFEVHVNLFLDADKAETAIAKVCDIAKAGDKVLLSIDNQLDCKSVIENYLNK
jgi:UDP-N-acetylmuramoylalanine-D-glutamate ligase